MVGNLAWNVDATTSDMVYRVEFDGHCDCSAQANTHCSRCHVCPYAVTCSCRAGALAGVACSHSHAVKLYGGQPTIEPPVHLTLQAEPQEIEIQQTSYALIYAKVNALVRQGDEGALETLSAVAEQFSSDYIIRKMRTDHDSKESKLYFVTKKDLWNIMTKHNLAPGIRDKNDLTSLSKREDERNPNDGIRYFKMPDEPTGKGFILGQEKIKQWAAFERRGVVMSTSMFGERWHLRIKQEKLKRKANARVDYVVDMLIKAVEELAVDFEITDRRKLTSSFRVKENNVQHRLAVRLYKENSDKIHMVGNLAWNVDATTSDMVYRVEFDGHCDCSAQANTHCSRCHVCPYAVTCSCRAGALAGVACSHSHAVKLYGINLLKCKNKVHFYFESLYLGGQPTIEPPVHLTLQAEPQEIEIQQTVSELRPTRDIRGELHAIRDEVAKSYALIYAKVNALVRQGDEGALETLSAVAERMRIVANEIDVPIRATALLTRPDVPLTGGRTKLQKTELYTRSRIRKQMRRSQSVENIRVDPDEIAFCSLCFEEDPVLPDDMDPEEPDARETEWMRCTNCRVWVHAVCGRGVRHRKCRACKVGEYSIYVYA
ncbi:hypothetical protein OSTOST_08019 [Ostertagia ostertagi]